MAVNWNFSVYATYMNVNEKLLHCLKNILVGSRRK